MRARAARSCCRPNWSSTGCSRRTTVQMLAGRHRLRARRLAALARPRAAVHGFRRQAGDRSCDVHWTTMIDAKGNRHPRAQLPAADPEGEEGARRHAERRAAQGGRHRPGLGARLPGLRAADRQRAGRAADASNDEFVHCCAGAEASLRPGERTRPAFRPADGPAQSSRPAGTREIRAELRVLRAPARRWPAGSLPCCRSRSACPRSGRRTPSRAAAGRRCRR